MLARRCGAAPRPGPLDPGEAAAVGARLANRRRLPLRLGRQSAPSKAALSLGLVPVDENNRSVRSEKFGAIVPAPRPDAVGFRLPVYRTFSTLTFSPCPAVIAPKFTNAVTASLNKRCKFAIRDRRASNAERVQFDFVRPFLVIKDKPLSAHGAEPPGTARHFGITRQRPGGSRRMIAKIPRRRVGERFAHVGQCFDVHVLVTDRQFVEIAGGLRKVGAGKLIALVFQNLRQIGKGGVAIRQIETPARVVRYRAGIPQIICAIDQRRLAVAVPQRPLFVKPADVADLPQHRIDDVELEAHQLF